MRAKDTWAVMAAGALLCALSALAADGYPVRPVRLIVTGPAGAGIDLDSRAVAQKMSEFLGRQIVVDNRAAASGIVGMEIAAKAKADGYTLVTAGLGPLAAFPSLYRKLPYDLTRDFAPVFSGIAPVLGNIKAGRLKALAVSAPRRVATLAEVPTFAEADVPTYEANAWVGMLAPRGTPQPIIERLHSVAAKAVSAPEVRERMIGFGGLPMGGTPAEFAQYIKVEQAKWSKVIHDANVRIE